MAKKQKVADDPMSQYAVTTEASSIPSQLEAFATPSLEVPTAAAAASEGVYVYV